jgi:electron transport complex protein RnfE
VKKDVTLTGEFTKGLWVENPVFVRVLAMCPVLAVTNSCMNGLTMGLASLFVLTASNMLVAMLRRWIPHQVRIACFVLIIATFVTIVDYAIQAISLELHQNLGAFISLIVANCLILSRAEAFAARNTVLRSTLDGLGMGVGFLIALLAMSAVRELLGAGALFGVQVMPDSFEPWIVMVLPGGGFFTLGLWLLLFNWLRQRREAAEAQGGEVVPS